MHGSQKPFSASDRCNGGPRRALQDTFASL
jgi:hypothetical protein